MVSALHTDFGRSAPAIIPKKQLQYSPALLHTFTVHNHKLNRIKFSNTAQAPRQHKMTIISGLNRKMIAAQTGCTEDNTDVEHNRTKTGAYSH